MNNNNEKLEEFKKTLAGKSKEELLELEQTIIKESDERAANVTFKLEKKGYKEAAEAIRSLLNKQSVQWQYTLGLITMYEFWNPVKFPETVNYPMLDGTLRTLGEMKFEGYDEWKMVIVINNYFESARKEYVDTTNGILFDAARHNAVLDELKKLDPNIVNDVDNLVQGK